MSMPNFPELPDITREDVLNQIVTSVAYEELALSHILNAEGEKIQYALGTLPGNPNEATIGDVLDVNESVGSMLDTVLDNQMILSSKLTSALSANTTFGTTGSTGAEGAIGSPTGVTGAIGLDGAMGATGSQGALGATGSQGAAGAAGINAINGAAGSLGAAGTVGATGLTGIGGITGADSLGAEAWGDYWATTQQELEIPDYVGTLIPANVIEYCEDEDNFNMANGGGVITLSSDGYYLVSYRIVLESPTRAGTYVSQGTSDNIIPASVVNMDLSYELLVYEKQFIARFEDTNVYFSFIGLPGSYQTTAPGGIVFSMIKLKNLSLFLTPLRTTMDAADVLSQEELVTVTTIPPGLNVTWSSSDDSIATVDAQTGTVSGGQVGTVKITATLDSGEAASYTLDVGTYVKFVAAGSTTSYAVKTDGTVWRWGRKQPESYSKSATPVAVECYYMFTDLPIERIRKINAIAVGTNHTMMAKSLNAGGEVWGLGDNNYYQVGNMYNSGSIALQATDLSDVIAVAAEDDISFALKSNGTVWGMGHNLADQLGVGPDEYYMVCPALQVLVLSDITAIAIGGASFLNVALKQDGTVWTWGQGSGTPAQMQGLTDVTAITTGTGFTLTIKSDGTVWAWGDNDYGQLGDNSTTSSLIPVQTWGLTDVISIAAGWYHALALKSDGTVWAWGYNVYGQLGDGTTIESLTPVQVSNLTDVIAVAGGGRQSLALKADHSVWAWGFNNYGQLGDGTETNSSIPVRVVGEDGVGWL